MKEEPIASVPNKTDAEKAYNNLLMANREVFSNFLKENGIKGWPTTNWDNQNSFHRPSFLKFWQGNVIG